MNQNDMDGMRFIEGTTPVWLKRTAMIAGLILMIIGIPLAINLLCLVPIMLLNASGSDATIYGVVSLTLALTTIGVGAALFIHANRALKNKPSKPLQFPSQPILLVGIFVFLIGLGLVVQAADIGTGLFFPPISIGSGDIASIVGSGLDDPARAGSPKRKSWQMKIRYRRARPNPP